MINFKSILLGSVVTIGFVTVLSCSTEPQVSYESLTCQDLSDQWVGHKWKDNFKRKNEILAINVSQRLDKTTGNIEGMGCDSVATLKYGLTKREMKNHEEEIILQAWKQTDGSVKHEFAFCYLWPCEKLFNDR